MAISFACKCGKRLQAKDELAGKKIRCPGCRVVLAAPRPLIKTGCACGKSFRVKAELAGKGVRCPGCRQVVLVPGAPSAQPAPRNPASSMAAPAAKPKTALTKAPVKKPAPTTTHSAAQVKAATVKKTMSDDAFDSSQASQQRPTPSSNETPSDSSFNLLPWLGGGAVLMLLGIVAWYFLFPVRVEVTGTVLANGKPIPDAQLRWVSEDRSVFASGIANKTGAYVIDAGGQRSIPPGRLRTKRERRMPWHAHAELLGEWYD